MLLRSGKRRDHWPFALLALNAGLWYLTTFFTKLLPHPFFTRLNLAFGVLLPLAAVQFFRAFIADENRLMQQINRAALFIAALIIATTATPFYQHIVVRTAVLAYVIVFLVAPLAMLFVRSRQATSRFEGGRLAFLTAVGGLAAFFTLIEYLPYLGVEIPPVGTVLVLVFLYMLYQSVLQYRLIDLYELAGRLGVLTALSFTLAAILWLLVHFGGQRYFLHAVVASLAVLVLVDPVRSRVREKIGQVLFRDRFDLEGHVLALRRTVAHVLESNDLSIVLMNGLEQSRRVTHASLYLLREGRRHYDLVGHLGPEPVPRLEMAPAGPLLERLKRDGFVILENVERALSEQRHIGEDREAETLYEIAQTMRAMHSSVCLPVESQEGDLYGILSVRDERLLDAFSPEEVQLLAGLAAQAAIALENSRQYQQLKERDRLAAMGEMAAGLAHEIRNPLGAIKASAQFLTETGLSTPGDEDPDEFLDIIVEEVDRLNRVVSTFLDYAKPSKGDPRPTDVNLALDRTAHFIRPECQAVGTELTVELDPELPLVRIDLEQFRQVLLNLTQNALQAMAGGGSLRLETARVMRAGEAWAEIAVRDTGPGITDDVLPKLFVPFVTTKERGTGLGLALSQRIIAAAGGRILVRTRIGEGTTFLVRLPGSVERTSRVELPETVEPEEAEAADVERSGRREPVETTPDTAGPESPHPESPDPESPHPESPHPESPHPESPHPESPHPESPDPESPHPESPHPESPDAEAEVQSRSSTTSSTASGPKPSVEKGAGERPTDAVTSR